MTVSAPGNLLIAGEYLVLEEGGPGVALALEPRAYARAEPAASWSVEAFMGPGRARERGSAPLCWAPGREAELPLAAAVFRAAQALWRQAGADARPQAIELDSSAFFGPDGRKAGFGSSAAAAVALAFALGMAAGLEGKRLKEFALKAALLGHRAAQGGKGSGYDVYASAHGGIGLFVGGAEPSWRALPGLALPPALLFPGPAPVSSARAVALFQAWRAARRRGPAAADGALERSRRAALALASSRSRADSLAALAEARLAGLELGRAIGVPALLDAPPGLAEAAGREPLLVKASGAGDELGMAFFDGPPGAAEGYKALEPTEGPLWRS